MNRTYSPKLAEIEHRWWVVDAAGVPLGRLATVVATLLTGKHQPTYAPHIDTGDFVIVLNAEKAVLTGRKEDEKVYYRHSGYPGGIKQDTFAKLHAAKPERVLTKAVKGMLPKGPLGYAMLRKLKVYAGDKHPHSAQQPKAMEI